jgi:hypothetical protein
MLSRTICRFGALRLPQLPDFRGAATLRIDLSLTADVNRSPLELAHVIVVVVPPLTFDGLCSICSTR